MSDIPSDYRDRLDLREQLTRIDKAIDEAGKLRAEARKFDRERWVIPVTVLGALLAAIVARLPELLHAFGWPA
jgi:hypothetical protein